MGPLGLAGLVLMLGLGLVCLQLLGTEPLAGPPLLVHILLLLAVEAEGADQAAGIPVQEVRQDQPEALPELLSVVEP